MTTMTTLKQDNIPTTELFGPLFWMPRRELWYPQLPGYAKTLAQKHPGKAYVISELMSLLDPNRDVIDKDKGLLGTCVGPHLAPLMNALNALSYCDMGHYMLHMAQHGVKVISVASFKERVADVRMAMAVTMGSSDGRGYELLTSWEVWRHWELLLVRQWPTSKAKPRAQLARSILKLSPILQHFCPLPLEQELEWRRYADGLGRGFQ